MRTLKAIIVALSFTSITASAAIINNVEFPEAFVQVNEVRLHVDSEVQLCLAAAIQIIHTVNPAKTALVAPVVGLNITLIEC